MMRLPVAMGLVSCSFDLNNLVRPTAISVLAQHGDGLPLVTTTTPLLLDQTASELVTALEMARFPRHACTVQNKASIP
jgi:HEAT repeat protein